MERAAAPNDEPRAASSLDELLRGSWDFHCHCYPEFAVEQQARLDDVRLVQSLSDAGMAGVVLKSHLWPTATRAYYLQRYEPDIRVLGSITLNTLAGGIDPLAVEAAGRLGAKVVFFPTWSALHDQQRGGISLLVQSLLPHAGGEIGPGLRVIEGRRLTPEAKSVLEVARAFDMVVCTGHLSPREALMLCAAGHDLGLPVIFSHPWAASVGASLEEMRDAAATGALVEFCVLHFTVSLHRPVQPEDVARAMREIGPEHCLLTTDAFYPWAPPAPELLRLGLGVLRALGLSDQELRRLTVDNPRRLLRLPEGPPHTAGGQESVQGAAKGGASQGCHDRPVGPSFG